MKPVCRLLLVCLALVLLCTGAAAQELPCVYSSFSVPGEFTGYRPPGGGWIITGYTGSAEQVEVPQWMEGEPVYQLYDRMMTDNRTVVRLVLPKHLDSIGNSAFKECTALEQVDFPQSLRLISSYAFSKCAKLKQIALPDTLEEIYESAFSYCHALTEVTIPSGVSTLGRYAFSHCEGLTAAVLPDSLTLLEEGLFYGCTALASVTIPAGVTKIRPRCFDRCPLLVLTVTPGTEGERYAQANGIPYVYGE